MEIFQSVRLVPSVCQSVRPCLGLSVYLPVRPSVRPVWGVNVFFCYFVIITYIYSRIIYYCFVIWFRFAHILAAGVFSASILWPSTSQPAYQLSVRPSNSPSSVSLYFIYGFLDSKLFGFWLFFLSAEGILSILFLFLTKGSCFCNSVFFIFTCCNNHHGRRSVSPCKGLSVCSAQWYWLGSSVFIGGRSKYNC